MPTFMYDGEEFELVSDFGDLLLDDAEIIEEELGLDMREVRSLPLSKAGKVFVLISLRRRRPHATLADAGKVKMGVFLAAFTDNTSTVTPADAPDRAPVEFTGAVELGVAATDGASVDGGEVLSPTSAGSEPSAQPATA